MLQFLIRPDNRGVPIDVINKRDLADAVYALRGRGRGDLTADEAERGDYADAASRDLVERLARLLRQLSPGPGEP